MKIHTLEDLVDRLDYDFSWRKKELSVLRSLVEKNKNNELVFQAMARSIVSVLYGHWEGFIKHAATHYLEYVSRKELNYCNLNVNFLAIAFKTKLNASLQSDKASIFIESTDFILNQQHKKCSIPWKTAIKTRANLNSNVLKEIILLVGLDYSHYETKEKLIDNTLLYYRNNIAHGRELYLPYDQLQNLYKEIVDLMTFFYNQIENAACIEAFKKN